MAYVRLAMKLATNRETGVISTTTSVIGTLSVSMKMSVPRMVITPVKSWVKPMSRPSANVSTSEIMRLTVSPEGWASRYRRGSLWMWAKASRRMSRTVS